MTVQPARVFVNYRQRDRWLAVRLDEILTARFGPDLIFLAGRTIRPGEDFVTRITAAIDACTVLLAIIGVDWLDVRDATGRRAIDGDQDWVRLEIALALASGTRVIPVLVDDTSPLRQQDLPVDIQALARCQYLRVSYRNAQADLARVADTLGEFVPVSGAEGDVADSDSAPGSVGGSARATRTRRRLAGAVAIVAASVALLAGSLGPDRLDERKPVTPDTLNSVTPRDPSRNPAASSLPPEAGRWDFVDLPHSQIPDRTGNDRTLTPNTGTLTDIGRDRTVFLTAGACLKTAEPVLDTTRDYTVAAWVRPGVMPASGTVISQDGAVNSGFMLRYSSLYRRFTMSIPTTDQPNEEYLEAKSKADITVGSWVHLAATYTAANNFISLYLNATREDSNVAVRRNAKGPTRVGCGQWHGKPDDWWQGHIADVRVYQAVLTDEQLKQVMTFDRPKD
ncbi:LamG-like jellyroll fold domain-containing protein [Micromonospora marina]|uniref:LamG-like jellyroll fold domain-containing protein n=1 Tax=Micromonospora marina TaxID=307120 RepID=UPI0034570CB2